MEQLIEAILRILQEAGFPAVRQMPQGKYPHLEGAVTAVGLQAAKTAQSRRFSYLGRTEKDGEELELYGKELEAEIFLQTLCPRSRGAEAAMQRTDEIAQMLSGPLDAVSLSGFSVGPCSYDAQADVFTMTVTAQVSAYLYALAEEDGTEFTDFILKGEVK